MGYLDSILSFRSTILLSGPFLLLLNAQSLRNSSAQASTLEVLTISTDLSPAVSSTSLNSVANNTLRDQSRSLSVGDTPESTSRAFVSSASPGSLSDANAEKCYSSWFSELSFRNDPMFWKTMMQEFTVKTDVLVFETINSFGRGVSYTECDKIPRFRFTEKPTSSSASSATVTVTREEFRYHKAPNLQIEGWDPTVKEWDPTDEDLVYPKHSKWKNPHCKLDEKSCGKLWAGTNGELGALPSNASRNLFEPPWDTDCGMVRHCRMDLKEVILIYWPDDTQTRNICGSNSQVITTNVVPQHQDLVVFKTNAITFRGQDLYLRKVNDKDWAYLGRYGAREADLNFELGYNETTRKPKPYLNPSVMTGEWTFTSPTIYMAHRDITAGIHSYHLDPRSGLDGIDTYTTIRKAGMVPVRKEDVFSLRPPSHTIQTHDAVRYAHMVASGGFNPVMTYHKAAFGILDIDDFEAVPVDLRDLEDPVPAKEYFDARYDDCWGSQTHCGTITDDSYRPRLSLARSFWSSILPDGFYCVDPLVVDPPITLRPIKSKEYVYQALNLASEAFPAAQTLSTEAGASEDPKGYANHPRPGHRTQPGQPVETKMPSGNLRLGSRPGDREHSSAGDNHPFETGEISSGELRPGSNPNNFGSSNPNYRDHSNPSLHGDDGTGNSLSDSRPGRSGAGNAGIHNGNRPSPSSDDTNQKLQTGSKPGNRGGGNTGRREGHNQIPDGDEFSSAGDFSENDDEDTAPDNIAESVEGRLAPSTTSTSLRSGTTSKDTSIFVLRKCMLALSFLLSSWHLL